MIQEQQQQTNQWVLTLSIQLSEAELGIDRVSEKAYSV